MNGRMAKYQFLEIRPNRDNGCLIPHPLTLRIDSSGKMEMYVYKTGVGQDNMFACGTSRALVGGEGKWVSFMPGRKFNGNIYGDGDIQLLQGESVNIGTVMEKSYRRSGHILDGGFDNMFPAVAAFQKLEIGAGRKIHIASDLVLEQMPCTYNCLLYTSPSPRD